MSGERGTTQQAAGAARPGAEMAAAPGSAATRHTDWLVQRQGCHEGTGGGEISNTIVKTGKIFIVKGLDIILENGDFCVCFFYLESVGKNICNI